MQISEKSSSGGIIAMLAGHPIAANVLMVAMLASGAFALTKLTSQFFPTFDLEVVTVRTTWSAANPEDVERSITTPLEEAIRSIDRINKMTSSSALGVSVISVEFEEGADLIEAVEQVKQQVNTVRNLPENADDPQVQRVIRYERVGRILLSSKEVGLSKLHQSARQIEADLLSAGIDKISFLGLPKLEMRIRLNQSELSRLGLSISDVGRAINQFSTDVPVGNIGKDDIARDVRVLAQGRNVEDFSNLILRSSAKEVVRLSDVATIKLGNRDSQVLLYHEGHPAIQMTIERIEGGDTLKAAEILKKWHTENVETLKSELIDVDVFDRRWVSLQQRINVLVENGLSGLVLVLLVLYLFMRARVAFWVAIGIPSSFMLTLFVLWLIGGSINMISVFALIMALGIIVDDAVVVGEDGLRHFEEGDGAYDSAVAGAHRMTTPIIASSLTTIAAFIPLLLIGGTIGKILYAIPIVIICVIVASVLESFWVLPGHLHHAFQKMNRDEDSSGLRYRFEQKFNHFREHGFDAIVRFCLRNRLSVLSCTIGALVLAFGMMAAGLVRFEFFPSPDGREIYLQANFVPGTPQETVRRYLTYAESQLAKAEEVLGEKTVLLSVNRVGTSGGRRGDTADYIGSIHVEVFDPDKRTKRNRDFIAQWRKLLVPWEGLEQLSIYERQVGPPGRDFSVRLYGPSIHVTKQASLALQQAVKELPGTSNIEDDLPYGKDQLVFELTQQATAQGLTVDALARQLRNAFSSLLVQIYTQDREEIEVRVSADEAQSNQLGQLQGFTVTIPSGQQMPLDNLVVWKSRQGFEAIRHFDAQAAIEVFADLDPKQITFNELRPALVNQILPELEDQYRIRWAFSGRAESQKETLGDMRSGAVIGLGLIYIILAWVFASWGWPLLVMMMIPLGLIGAIFGHWLLGINLTILSIFGLFGLSGILINDSIILVVTYRRLLQKGLQYTEALVLASKQRLRAVLLTSLTTIGGLTPLLFEKSLQAQFLIPMAATLVFGLAVSTILILVVVPVQLSLYEQVHLGFQSVRKRWSRVRATA